MRGKTESGARPWLSTYEALGLRWDAAPEIGDETISRWVRRHAEQFGDREALVYLGGGITYRALDRMADRFAHLLWSLGLEAGATLGIQLPNTPQYVAAWLAAARLGVVTTSVSPLLRPAELAEQLDDAKVEVLLTFAPLFDAMVRPVVAERPALEHVLVSGATDLVAGAPTHTVDETLGAVRVQGLAAALADRPDTPVPDVGRSDAVLYVQYTGGTTGKPKGAELTSRNLLLNNAQVDVFYGYRTGREVVASAFPFFHIGGAALLFNGLRTAATNIIVPDPRNMAHVCGEMTKRPPTVIAAVPALYQMLLAEPAFRALDLSRLRIAVSGGAPFSEAGIAALEEVIGPERFCEVYGMTETSPVQTLNPARRLKPGFVGVPVPGTDLRIVDAADGTTPMPIGEPGEIIVRGPQVMRGYRNRPEETAEALRTLDGHTWMYTGDIGFLDDEGYLKVCDRRKDMLIVGGFKVFSVEVENKVASRPEVAMCAVVGRPDRARPGNEIVRLVVQRTPDAPRDEAALRATLTAWCRQIMSPYKVPKEIIFVDALPLTAVGKVDKVALRRGMA